MKIHKPKKSLGQNFLKSEQALREIIKAGDIKSSDTVFEIGPGKGALTERLLEKANQVVAIEKDQELVFFLNEKFKQEIEDKKLILIEGDVLDIAMSKVPFDRFDRYKIIANIPYNITGAILKKFLTDKNQPELMVLMVQHEVAKRIVARDGKESILSVSVKAYGEPKIIMKVGARYFSPAPKVDSAVIKISNISRDLFFPPLRRGGLRRGEVNEAKFWQLVHAGFAHKRKVLISNLKQSSTVSARTVLAEVFKKIGVPERARAEDLTLEDWVSLCQRLE